MNLKKSLAIKKFALTTNSTNSDSRGTIRAGRSLMIFPYIRFMIKKISKSINKSINLIGYRCLNKLNKFFKIHKDKINMKKIIMKY